MLLVDFTGSCIIRNRIEHIDKFPYGYSWILISKVCNFSLSLSVELDVMKINNYWSGEMQVGLLIQFKGPDSSSVLNTWASIWIPNFKFVIFEFKKNCQWWNYWKFYDENIENSIMKRFQADLQKKFIKSPLELSNNDNWSDAPSIFWHSNFFHRIKEKNLYFRKNNQIKNGKRLIISRILETKFILP